MRKLIYLFLLVGQLATAGEIPAYQDRFGRAKPVVAVVGENSGTELTDFVIPYGVLARSGAVQLLSVAPQTGPLSMRPALKLQPDATTAEFDQRYPQGADYVIVPAVVKPDDATLVAWVAAQGAKGATVVSICDGALIVANAGLFKGKRATAHWATESYRKEHYPDVQWVGNIRYVADGKVISSAGVSAAMPTALALVEAIAGNARATEVAQQIGVADWSTTHDSDIFRPRLGTNLTAYITGYTNQWFHSRDSIGVSVAAGVDEITLAFTADAWSRSKRSKVYTVAANAAPLQSLSGLTILPDHVQGAADAPDLLPAGAGIALPGKALDRALEGLEQRYGRRTALLVALEFEYPSYH
ncbi:DJ-1/PfpI family protein [Duganella sp. S19_KUP01_CR8]|uniref:DJ-1/PfpI family protein n=1 Tax=Duganella sp. S19_KUP01_CR8 TaxID=3025502 RepID=UPI002FCDD32D